MWSKLPIPPYCYIDCLGSVFGFLMVLFMFGLSFKVIALGGVCGCYRKMFGTEGRVPDFPHE